MAQWYDGETGRMSCGCTNHGVYTWEMPCPLWREKIHDCIREWHEDAQNVLPEYLVEHLYNKLGITEEMYHQWVEDGHGMVKVVHCKKEPYDVYIGRPSKWGNPFSIDRGDGTREEVINRYREYVLVNEYLMSCLHELKGKTLGCWCKPKACHGDVLAKLVKENT